MYLPTFREYQATMAHGFTDTFLQKLGEKYNILFRGHYFTSKQTRDKVFNVSSVSLYKLFSVADLLVTDYSSVFFDFSVEHKPIYLYEPDLVEYRERRGLYLDGYDVKLPVAYSENMLESMLNRDYDMKHVLALERFYNPMPKDLPLELMKQIILSGGELTAEQMTKYEQ